MRYRELRQELKVYSFCVVLAGEHALRYDPDVSPQHPAPPGHLWNPNDFAATADPMQTRSVIKPADGWEDLDWGTLAPTEPQIHCATGKCKIYYI